MFACREIVTVTLRRVGRKCSRLSNDMPDRWSIVDTATTRLFDCDCLHRRRELLSIRPTLSLCLSLSYRDVLVSLSHGDDLVPRSAFYDNSVPVHQSLALLAPIYLTTDIHLVSEYGRRPLRYSTDRTQTISRNHNRFGDRSFAVQGLVCGTVLSLRQISGFGQFRRYLKNHLFGFEKSQRSVTHDFLR